MTAHNAADREPHDLDHSARRALIGIAAAHSSDREPHDLDHSASRALAGPPAPRLSQSQLAHADMIAAAQHATRAVDALERALQRYTAEDRAEHALTRLRGRNALRLLAEAIERIDVTNGERFDG